MRLRPLAASAALAVAGLLVAGCGDDIAEDTTTVAGDSVAPLPTTASTVGAAPTTAAAPAIPKPEVKIPATIPTTLVVTPLSAGTGAGAKKGDLVVVNYVGVRSADGTEFDNSYDKGTPFPVTLGAGGVIKGWDAGLVDAKQGERVQLDIPNDLAYGSQDKGAVIKAGDALTFVIDVVAVIPGRTAADAPKVTVAPAANTPTLVTKDLVVGTGDAYADGKQIAFHLLAFRADTGARVTSTYDSGQPITFASGSGNLLPGLLQTLTGMKVGGQRQATIPFADAFGTAGSTNLGFPGSVDLIVVVELVAVY